MMLESEANLRDYADHLERELGRMEHQIERLNADRIEWKRRAERAEAILNARGSWTAHLAEDDRDMER